MYFPNIYFIVCFQKEDCDLHIANLILGYSLGLKENVKTETVTDSGGKKQKVKVIVTLGGSFENGARLIKIGRKICNHFTASPQRKEDLTKICQCCSLPPVALLNFPDTCVGHVNKMYQSLIMNYCALKTA